MLRILMVKELKDMLRDKKLVIGMILAPLLIYVALGAVVGFSARESMKIVQERARIGLELGIINLDGGAYSRLLIDFLTNYVHARLVPVNSCDPRRALEELASKNVHAVLLVPRGFSHNISLGKPASLYVFMKIGDLSLSSIALAGLYSGIPRSFSDYLSSFLIVNSTGYEPRFLKNPVRGIARIELAGVFLDLELVQGLVGQLFMLPIAPMLVVGYAASLAAMSIGVEKEEKTLEVLLSLPISRRSIVLAKLTGSLVISAISSVSMLLGFTYYIYSVSHSVGNLTTVSIVGLVGTEVLALFALSVFLSVLLASTLGLYLGSYGEDVRSAQSMVGFLWIVVLAPLYLAMFSDLTLDPVPKNVAISSTPFTAPVIVLKAFISGRPLYAALSLLSEAVLLTVVVLLLARRFEGENLLVGRGSSGGKGIRIRFPRRGRQGHEQG